MQVIQFWRDVEIIKEGYTRISNILGIFQAYATVPKAKLKRAQDTGTIIHSAIEQYFKGDFEPLPLKTIPYMESFFKWVGAVHPSAKILEARLYDDDLKITGRVDMVATIEEELYLVDFKTGSWAHPEIWNLQATFYRHLLAKNGHQAPRRFLFVQLKCDGTAPSLCEFEYKESNWGICLNALECYRYFNQGGSPFF